ncbi:MAG: glycosyltransferase family 2 protein [Hyphomonadaceae bacterium]|nr:glycosyltransferase family 2 protein [Hyphomonadaceae bacterium]
MRASAIIVSYRTGDVISLCLGSLSEAEGIDEIILVDNGNAATEVAALDVFIAAHPHARILRGQGNVGFAGGCNLGARAATGEALVFLNPDVVLAAGAVPRLIAALTAAPPPAIVGGDLRDGYGRPERGARRDRLTLWRAIVSFTGLSALERVSPVFRDFNRHRDPMPAGPVRVGAVSGALLCMRRADFESLGGFDEHFFVHVEDVDICRRAEDAGWPVLYAPGPHGVHVRSTAAVSKAEVERHKARGFARYFAKHARSPFDRALASLLGGLLLVILPLRARR